MDRARHSDLMPRRWTGALLALLQRAMHGESSPAQPCQAVQPAEADPFPDHPCVLVVDDNPLMRTLTSEALSLWGITPLLASDGAEAVALACECRPDLILMDLQMPVLDGFGATGQIRQFEREHSLARVPVVAYTSSSVSADEPLLRHFGLDGALDKPCDAIALRDCLLRWCPPRARQVCAN